MLYLYVHTDIHSVEKTKGPPLCLQSEDGIVSVSAFLHDTFAFGEEGTPSPTPPRAT